MRLQLVPDVEVVEVPVQPAPDWVLCIGDSRTGTSAAAKLISAHPEAMMLCEYWLFGRMPTWVQPTTQGVMSQVDNRALARAYRKYYSVEGHLTTEFLRARLEAERAAIAPGATVFGDKKACYRFCLQDVETLLPRAKLLLTTRDPWDVAASLMDVDWWRNRHDHMSREQQAHAALTQAQAADVLDRKILEKRDNVLQLSFESMADRPNETFGNVLDFLGLSTHDYPWQAIEQTHYRQARGHWTRIPELVALRESEGN